MTVIQRAIYLQLSSWEVVTKHENFLKAAPQAETRARQGTPEDVFNTSAY